MLGEKALLCRGRDGEPMSVFVALSEEVPAPERFHEDPR